MKKVIFAYIGLVIIIVIIALYRNSLFGMFKNLGFAKNASVEIKNQSFKVTIADDEKERTTGLSNKEGIGDLEGMLFVFETKGKPSFWMRDVKFPLDIIFIDDNKIVDIFESVPIPAPNQPRSELPLYIPKQVSNYVLELNGGTAKKFDLKVGDQVILKNIK